VLLLLSASTQEVDPLGQRLLIRGSAVLVARIASLTDVVIPLHATHLVRVRLHTLVDDHRLIWLLGVVCKR